MTCGKCGAPNEAERVRCDYCGTPLDRPAPAPDAIARLVEDKARQIVREEREREQRDAQNAAADARAHAARDELAGFRLMLDETRLDLERANAAAPGLFAFSKGAAIFLASLFAFLGVMILPILVEPLMGRSLVGATIFCPAACDTCRGPGRIFNWQETSNGTSGAVSLQLCDNDKVDIRSLTTAEVINRQGELVPYELTMWANALPDALLGALFGLLAAPVVVGWSRRRATRRDRALHAAAVERLERMVRERERVR